MKSGNSPIALNLFFIALLFDLYKRDKKEFSVDFTHEMWRYLSEKAAWELSRPTLQVVNIAMVRPNLMYTHFFSKIKQL